MGIVTRLLRQLEKWALRFLLLSMSCFLVTATDWGQDGKHRFLTPFLSSFLTEIATALAITAGVIMTTEPLLKKELLRAVDERVNDALTMLGRVTSLALFPIEMGQMKLTREIELLMSNLYSEYVGGLRVIEVMEDRGSVRKFVLDDKNWAMDSNRRFYEQLAKIGKNTPIEVRVTQPGRFQTWSKHKSDVEASLAAQQAFIDGDRQFRSIIRFFVGRDAQPNDELLAIMVDIEKRNIQTRYLFSADHDIPDFTWVPGVVYMQWNPAGLEQRIATIDIVPNGDSDSEKRREEYWKELMGKARPLSYYLKKEEVRHNPPVAS